jgi:haloacetate dehalogenase
VLFDGFEVREVPCKRGHVSARVGGSGPPLLVLHGYPQTHLMWHAVAPALAEHFTVVAADLPGYGLSFRPTPNGDHAAHSKRALAHDLVAVMARLGYAEFAVAGHDRGGRVGYRMALDHPEVVTRLAVLDIVPTGEVWARADAMFALAYWHWGFLAQPAPLPEDLILGAADAYWQSVLRMGIKPGDPRYPKVVVAAYRAQLSERGTVRAMCEDYRAGATIDRRLDDEGGELTCPVLALWGADGALPLLYEDPLEVWRGLAPDVTGRAIAGASHFICEDAPGEVAAELLAFLCG